MLDAVYVLAGARLARLVRTLQMFFRPIEAIVRLAFRGTFMLGNIAINLIRSFMIMASGIKVPSFVTNAWSRLATIGSKSAAAAKAMFKGGRGAKKAVAHTAALEKVIMSSLPKATKAVNSVGRSMAHMSPGVSQSERRKPFGYTPEKDTTKARTRSGSGSSSIATPGGETEDVKVPPTVRKRYDHDKKREETDGPESTILADTGAASANKEHAD